jgi:hypothetical protein
MTVLFGDPNGENECILLCPVCGFDYTHVRRAFTRMGSDEHEAECVEGTQVKGTTDERRSALIIEVECEDGHCFELVLQQYKGMTFVDWDEVTGI